MLMTKRTQGRPPRDSGINGREKLIEATRVYLQSNRKMSLTRTEIAQGCGVTPALISYYFKDKRSLLDAVIKPLIRSYAGALRAILDPDRPVLERMRETVRLLIQMSADNAFLVDYMLGAFALGKLDADDRKVFDDIHGLIAGLVGELLSSQVWRASDPFLTEVALWGMCRAFGEAIRLRHPDPPDSAAREALVEAEVDYVCRTFSAEVPSASRPRLAMAV